MNNQPKSFISIRAEDLRADCDRCFALCCAALCFTAADGFPEDKGAGRPCSCLLPDFKCSVYSDVLENRHRGCRAYDCFGAGQKVAQISYGGKDWIQAPESAGQMLEVFLIMQQLQQMLWYITGALVLPAAVLLEDPLKNMMIKTESLTRLDPESLLNLDIDQHRVVVNKMLQQVSQMVRSPYTKGTFSSSKSSQRLGRRKDLIGADLRGFDLRGTDLRGRCLIAADLRGLDLAGCDFIGADLRDTDLRGADLRDCIFLTQFQINTAVGNSHTQLPAGLIPPAHWD